MKFDSLSSGREGNGSKTFWQLALIFFLSFLSFDSAMAKGPGFCNTLFPHLEKMFPVHTLKMPVDHFHNESKYEPHSKKYFNNRYWFNDTYYKPGGPVIIQNAGEHSGLFELPVLQIGLLHELAKATNGLAVVLEHRYYGHSLPVGLHDTASFRFLTVEQAMADQAYFARNVVFPGYQRFNLSAPNTPWFAIGCSYPGALTAYERIQYPDLFWGAISSSGTTVSKENNWEYYEVVAEYSPPDCVAGYRKVINVADNILLGGNESQIVQLKELFHSSASTNNAHFANGLTFGYSLQVHNWIPCVNRLSNPEFCSQVSAPTVIFPKANNFTDTVKEVIANGGFANETDTLITFFLNYLGWARDFHIDRNEESFEDEIDATSTEDPSQASAASASASGSAAPSSSSHAVPFEYLQYLYQQCTELGGGPTGEVPPGIEPFISRLVDVHFDTRYCRKYFNISGQIDTTKLDQYGTYNLSYPRLMLTGGEADPWRPYTPLAAKDFPTRLNYSSTPDQPWFIIPGGTHCWDFFGIFESQNDPAHGIPPRGILEIHEMEKETFKRWLKEWHDAHPNYNVHSTE